MYQPARARSGLFSAGSRQPRPDRRSGGRARGGSIPILLSVLGFLFSSNPAAGASKYAGEFLKLGVGARALGMGGAFVALADDASGAYWNPAGLASLEQGELLFMHAEQFGSLANHDYFGFVEPLRGGERASSVGIGLIRFSVDDIQVTRDAYDDLNGNGEWDEGEPILTDQFRSASDTEYGLLLSYARETSDRWRMGGNVKLLRQGLLDNNSFGMGLDLGFLYLARPGLTIGLKLADATTTQISWDTGRRETVAPSFALGFRWTRPVATIRGTVTAAGDLNQNLDGRDAASQIGGGANLRAGLEYWFDRRVAARIGSDEGSFTAGAGLRYRALGVDYAYLSHDALDDTHRVSASLRF